MAALFPSWATWRTYWYGKLNIKFGETKQDVCGFCMGCNDLIKSPSATEDQKERAERLLAIHIMRSIAIPHPMIKRALFSRSNIENAKQVARDSFDYEESFQIFTEVTTKAQDLQLQEEEEDKDD